MFVYACIVLILKQQMEQFFIRQEVKLGEGFSLSIQKHLNSVFQVLEDGIIFPQYR